MENIMNGIGTCTVQIPPFHVESACSPGACVAFAPQSTNIADVFKANAYGPRCNRLVTCPHLPNSSPVRF